MIRNKAQLITFNINHSHHGKVPLPRSTAAAVAQRARPLHAVPAALAAVQRDVILGPGDAAGEAGAQLHAKLLDGDDIVHGDLQGTAHQVRHGRGDAVSSVEGGGGREEEEQGS